MVTREEVYKALDSEREYQNKLWGGHAHDNFNSVGDFLTYIDMYLTRAKEQYTTVAGHGAALEMLRKVTALGVACFEIHGVPKR